jgi:hypothetical protein
MARVVGFRKRKHSDRPYPITEREDSRRIPQTEKEAVELKFREQELKDSIEKSLEELDIKFDECDSDKDRAKVLDNERKLLAAIEKSIEDGVTGLAGYKLTLESRIQAQSSPDTSKGQEE